MPTEDDLKLPEIIQIFDRLPTLDVVRLTGGEPFVRADFPAIADEATRRLKPLVLHITTNGFLTDRLVRYCENRDRSVPLDLLISVDGMEGKHNEIRGNSKAWDMVTKSLRELAPRRKDLRLRLAVNQTVVDAEGCEHYKRLRDFLKPMKVPHHLVIAYESSATYNLEKDINLAPENPGDFLTFGDFKPQQVLELIDQAYADAVDLPWAERIAKRYYLKGIRNRLAQKQASPNPPCIALSQHLRIFPNGDVPTCQFNSRVVGNLRDQDFEEVWQSVRAAEQRKWVRACAGCWAECEVVPSAIYSLDLLRPMKR